MHAIVLTGHGGPEVLSWDEVPTPECRSTEVRIQVAAAGVNRADVLQRKGFYPPPAGASELLGLECSGVIDQIGDEVSDFAVGDQVCALLSGGGYAEYVTVPATQVLKVPGGVPLIAAAALMETVCTVWSNLVLTAGLKAGDTVLVHGGAGGIGTTAIQVARFLGARVLVTAGSPAKVAACTELGADVAINYRTEDWADRVRQETGGRGVDVILDVIGAKYLSANVNALATGGRLVIIGMQGGTRAELDLAALLSGRKSVIATTLRSRPATGAGSKAEVVDAVRRDLWPAVTEGRVRPIIGATFAIADAAAAHTLLESADSPGGKLVLVTENA